MARNEVVKIGDQDRRAPEAGRIRIGIQIPNTAPNARSKTRPSSIKTFRFTSVHKDLIELLAQQYGGTVEEWNEPKAKYQHQWQVISPVNQIRVYLPQNGLSQDYELWSAGGRERQCDGETVETIQMHGESAVPVKSACICDARKQRECAVKTRISVMLPNIPFMGVWRLESGSWAAYHEIPGMFEMITALQQAVVVDAIMGVEARTDRVGGKTRHYVVPTLGMSITPMEIQAGMANVQAISSGTQQRDRPRELGNEPVLALQQRNGGDTSHATEHEVVEGSVVTDLDLEWTPKLRELAAAFPSIDEVDFSDAVLTQANGDETVLAKIYDDVAEGRVEPTGFTAAGRIKWKQHLGG